MSGAATHKKSPLMRVIQAAALGITFIIMYGATKVAPHAAGPAELISSVGFLLLAGMLLSELLELVGLPHLTGYILAGVIAGPHVTHFVSHEAVEGLAPVNTLALALIALAGGAELRVESLKESWRSLAWATLLQSTVPFVGMALIFVAISAWLPFTHELSSTALLGVGLLWGIVSVTRSPSATLGILAQTRAEGSLASFSLAFVMASDIVVIVMLAATIAGVRPLIDPNLSFSLEDFKIVGREIVGSISIGTTLGLLLAAYLKLVGKQPILVLVAIGFAFTEVLRYLHFDPLLTFLLAGFVVQNVTSQGEKLLHSVEKTGGVVFVVFFATAGAHLDIPLLGQLWKAALLLCAMRTLLTYLAHRAAARIAGDVRVVRHWGWSGLVSQAGIALGIASVIERNFPTFGNGFRSLAIAAVAINELVGPVLFKFALDRSAESREASEPASEPQPSEAVS